MSTKSRTFQGLKGKKYVVKSTKFNIEFTKEPQSYFDNSCPFINFLRKRMKKSTGSRHRKRGRGRSRLPADQGA